MKTMKRVGAISLAALLSLGLVACGGGGEKDGAEKIVIYTGGSTEFIWRAGADEQAVWDAVEAKFLADTGIEIEFEVNFMGKDMKDKVTTALAGGQAVDVMISHTSGGSGVDDWMMSSRNYADLYNLIEDNGQNIIDNSVWTDGTMELDGLERLRTVDGEIIGIPSIISPYKFGILVRKDWMEACGYTDDESKVASGLKLVDNFVAFEEMAKAMKERYNLNYASTGAIFDLEKAGVVGAYGLDAGYYTNVVYEYEGKNYVIPGGGQEGYAEILELENRWAKSGVINPSSDSVTIDKGESEFIAGTTGIFFQDPTVTHLIKVARKCKIADPDAEFTVLGALTKDENSTDKGFMRNSVATFAACVPESSKQAELVVKYVDWMYSDVENYLLCQYGIEGTHWTNNGDGTYSFVEPYSITNAPYSGVLALVENQNVANLTLNEYSTEEKKWLETAADKTNYINNPTIDVLLWTLDESLNSDLWTAYADISTFCQLAWRGRKQEGTIAEAYATNRANFMDHIAVRGEAMYTLYSRLKGALEW